VAAAGGFKDVAELLLANKADVNGRDVKGRTPLAWAAYEGHRDVAELLLTNKADVNGKTNDGKTPLQVAVDRNHNDVAELLRRHGGKDTSIANTMPRAAPRNDHDS
jgi:ankyrin repeat protein